MAIRTVTDPFDSNFGALIGRIEGDFNWSEVFDGTAFSDPQVVSTDGGRLEQGLTSAGVYSPGLDIPTGDYEVTIYCKSSSGSDPGVSFVKPWIRTGPNGGGYAALISLTGTSAFVRIERHAVNVWSGDGSVTLDSDTVAVDFRNQLHKVTLRGAGTSIELLIDDAVVCSATDGTFSEGNPALWINSQSAPTYKAVVASYSVSWDDGRPPKGGGSTQTDPNPAASRVLSTAKLQLPRPPRVYSEADQSQMRRMIERFLTQLGAAAQGTQDSIDSAVTVLNDLEDVTVGTPADGDVLAYNTATEQWEATAASAGSVTTLEDLNDVDDTLTPSDGDVLTYNTSTGLWEAGVVDALPPTADAGDLLVSDGAEFDVLPVGIDGQVLTADSGEPLGVRWAAAGGGRGDVQVVTASLADLAVETGAVALGMSTRILRISADVPCRVRLYSTAAYRTADSARNIGTAVTGEHGMVLEVVLVTGNLTLDLNPQAIGSNMDGPPTDDLYYSIQNRSGGTTAVTVSIVRQILETA